MKRLELKNIDKNNIEVAETEITELMHKEKYHKFIKKLLSVIKIADNKKIKELDFEPVLVENTSGAKVIPAIHLNTIDDLKKEYRDIYIPIVNEENLSIPIRYLLNAGIKNDCLGDLSNLLKEFGYASIRYTFKDQYINL